MTAALICPFEDGLAGIDFAQPARHNPMAGCNVVIAASESPLGSAFVRIGLTCDSGNIATPSAHVAWRPPCLSCSWPRYWTAPRPLAREGGQGGAGRAAAIRNRRDGFATRAWISASLREIEQLFLPAGASQLQSRLGKEASAIASMAVAQGAADGIDALVIRPVVATYVGW